MAQSLYNTPILWINTYLKEKLEAELGFNAPQNVIPFFPTSPSTLEVLTQTFPDGNGIMAVWDRMFRLRRGPFPHIKSEQVLYYFYAMGEQPQLNMVRIQEAVLRLMDREDETAEEINAWAKTKGAIEVEGEAISPNFYFHKFKIYHLEEARDIIDFGTARTYAGNKIIIDYSYHLTEDPNNSNA
jgi:hypothetical protein